MPHWRKIAVMRNRRWYLCHWIRLVELSRLIPISMCFSQKVLPLLTKNWKMLPGYCSQSETLWNNSSRMRDRGTVILTKMFVSIRGIQRYIKNKDYVKSTWLCRIDEKSVAVRLTENFQTMGRGSFINRLRLRGGERSEPHNSWSIWGNPSRGFIPCASTRWFTCLDMTSLWRYDSFCSRIKIRPP